MSMINIVMEDQIAFAVQFASLFEHNAYLFDNEDLCQLAKDFVETVDDQNPRPYLKEFIEKLDRLMFENKVRRVLKEIEYERDNNIEKKIVNQVIEKMNSKEINDIT